MSVAVGTTTASTPLQDNYGGLKSQVAAYVQGQNLTGVLADAGTAINAAIDELNTRTWHWLNRSSDITLAADDRDYTLPADFKKPFALIKLNSSTKEVGRIYYQMPKQFLDSEWSDSTSGEPEHYTVRNVLDDRLLTLSKPPDSNFVSNYPKLRVHYYARCQHFGGDGETLGDLEIPPELRNYLLWRARWEVATMRGSASQVRDARDAYLREWRTLVADDNDIQTDWSQWR